MENILTHYGNEMEQLKSIVERIERLEERFQLVHEEQMECLREFWVVKFGDEYFGKDRRKLPLPIDRFIANVIAIPETNCLEWNGTIANNGYGHFSLDRIVSGAHRWFYDLIYGLEHKNDPKWSLDHLCRNRRCVNIFSHIEEVTQKENVIRGDWVKKKHYKLKCKHGHELTEDNVYISPKGQRSCRQCNHVRKTKWRKNRQ